MGGIMQSLEPFYEKKMTCVFCGKQFNTLRVRSRFAIPYQIDSDFCPHYRTGNYNPHFYFVTENNSEQEKRFLSLALNAYEESFVISDFTSTSMSEIKVLFMIGELSRRLGQYNKAVSYFSKIIQHENAKYEQKMVNMARDQWRVAVDENRQENK